jgi:hypothetical protein
MAPDRHDIRPVPAISGAPAVNGSVTAFPFGSTMGWS